MKDMFRGLTIARGGVSRSAILVLALFFLTVAYIAWCSMFDQEDLKHCICQHFDEAFECVRLSYHHTNPRIGEFMLYLLGVSRDGIGSYHAQILHYIFVPLSQLGALFLIFRIALPETRLLRHRSAALVLFVALFMLGTKQNFYWHCGNMCWLYPCIAAMLFFVIWEGIFLERFHMGMGKFLLSVPLAVIVGMSNENTSIIALLLFLGCGMRACIRQKRFCVTWQYVVVAVLLLAAAVVFYTAPCRGARAETAGWELSFHNILFNSLLSVSNWIYLALFYWREAVVAGLMLYIARRRGAKLFDGRLACLVMVLALLWCVLLAAPCWGAPRSFTPLDLMLCAVMLRMLHKILNHDGVGARCCVVPLVVQAVLTMTVLVPTMVLAAAQYRVRCQIADYAQAARERGETSLVLHHGDLDTRAVMPRFFHIPGCVVAHDLKPFVPLINISKKDYESGRDFEHRSWHALSGEWYPSSGDDVLNLGVAKRFGLESIFYVSD